MSNPKRKELFTVLGDICLTEVMTDFGKKVRHAFTPNSQAYLRDNLNKIPVGKKISITFYEDVPARSQQQLAYHMVLMGYIADYNQDSKEAMHDGIMRLKFGTRKIKIGNQEVEVRKSASDKAKMPMHKMQELIDYDLEICKFLNIKVPTAEELGYTSNKVETKVDVKKLHEGLEIPKGKPSFE